MIRELRERGISILITDHRVRETLEITDRSYVIRAGKVLCGGTPAEITRNADARKYYFGEGMNMDDDEEPEPSPSRPVRRGRRTDLDAA